MRLASILLLMLGVGAAMLAHASATGVASGPPAATASERETLRLTLADTLRGLHGGETADLVLSPGPGPQDWLFRGRAAPQSATRSIGGEHPLPHDAMFGRARLRCAPAPGCWEVTELKVSGAPLTAR
jgi:hypothetical protein